MKIVLIISLIIVGVIVYIFSRSTETNSVTGKLGDIKDHFEKLMFLDDGEGFLVVTVSETGDFIQFNGDKTGVQLDLPQITERQRELNSKFHVIAKELGLIVITSKGSDGAEFLDINIHGDTNKVSNISSKFIKQLFAVDENTDLIFTTN